MVRRSEERQSRFDKIRKRLAQEKLDSTGLWKAKVGDNKIRVLPEVGEMDFFFVNVGQHFLSRRDQHFCPDRILGLPCPICEFVSELYKEPTEENTKLAANIRVRRGWWMNIIDRSNEAAGPQILPAGKTIFVDIRGLVMDPQYGDLILDPDEGLDLTIHRTGTGRNDTEYTTHSDRETSPLNSDPDLIDEWLDTAMDLSPVELTDDPSEDYELMHDEEGNLVAKVAVETYDRIKEAFEGIDKEALRSDDDEEEPEDEVSSVISRHRGRRGRRR